MKTSSLRSQRGSVLVVGLIFAAIVAIALVSYLRMARSSAEMSQRAHLSNQLMNVCEAGLEQGLWSFNQANVENPVAWLDWSPGISANDKLRTFDGFPLFKNTPASVQVYMKNFNSTGFPIPVCIAKARLSPPNAPPIYRMVEITLTRRSFFGSGLVGKNGVRFNGNNTVVDSWVSGVDTNPLSPVPYSEAVRRPRGSVAALSVDATVEVLNANIYGYVSVGSKNVGGYVSVGPNGIISGNFDANSGFVDPTRVSGNFTADLPDVTVPTPTAFNTFSGSNAVVDGGTYPKATGAGVITDLINPSDQTYYYKVTSIDLDSSRGKVPVMTIREGCKVAFILQNGTGGSGTELVSTGNSSSLIISSGAQMSIYTAGNVRLAGQGVVNANGATTSLQIWGTNTSSIRQSVQVSGHAGLTGIIYAPNATVTITGNGDIKGAVVGSFITLNGNGNFHYDESLAKYGGVNPFKVQRWRELVSATQRAQHDSLFH